MGKSRHQRHLRTMRKLWVCGFHVEMVRPLGERELEVYIGKRHPFSIVELFAPAGGNGPGHNFYYTPPLKSCNHLMFIVTDDRRNAKIIYGWKDLADFAACGGFTGKEEEE